MLENNGIPHGDCKEPWAFVAMFCCALVASQVLITSHICKFYRAIEPTTKFVQGIFIMLWATSFVLVLFPAYYDSYWQEHSQPYASRCTDTLSDLSIILAMLCGAFGTIAMCTVFCQNPTFENDASLHEALRESREDFVDQFVDQSVSITVSDLQEEEE